MWMSSSLRELLVLKYAVHQNYFAEKILICEPIGVRKRYLNNFLVLER